MTNNTPAPVPAGWYPDPAGSPSQRWWNGSSWSDSLQAAPAASPYGATPQPYGAAPQPYGATPQPYGSVQAYGATQPYGSMAAYDPGQRYYSTPRAPEGTDPSTTQVWTMAFWPLLNLLGVVITAVTGGYSYSSASYSSDITPFDLVTLLISFLSYLGFVALAFADNAELKRRGVVRPFHWGFAFIPLVPLVYMIGRAVIVYSRTSRGLAPLFVYIGMGVLAMLVGGGISAFVAYTAITG